MVDTSVLQSFLIIWGSITLALVVAIIAAVGVVLFCFKNTINAMCKKKNQEKSDGQEMNEV